MPIESSTVTNCSPVTCTSRSVRPRQGRISASRPVTTCERLSLVETCTVRSSAAQRLRGARRCPGVAATKLPPSAKNTLALPSCIARIVSTVSRPCSRGGSKPNSSRSPSRNASAAFSQMPIVRSPCTLEWPRTGHSPAPGRPMLPRSSSRLTISWMVATASRCWVRPIAQQTMTRSDSRYVLAPARSRPRVSPVAAEHVVPVELRRGAATYSSKPRCARRRTRSSTAPGLDRQLAPSPRTGARSPAIRTWRKSSVRSVPLVSPLRRSAGCGSAQPGLGQRVDGDDAGAARLGLLQRGQHARVVGAGVLADHEDQVGGVEVLEQHRALADADRLGERRAARLVAHVRAVGQVVGAEAAHEQLVEERRLVAGAARGVERRLVRASAARAARSAIEREGVVPVDRLVVRRPRPACTSAR